ncbi:MAG: tRNA guanosine(34) transglycosylase Tgt [Planctomycetota bacterium]
MAPRFSFRLEATCPHTGARAGRFVTPHGEVKTPFFMPVGTRGTVKGIHPSMLRDIGSQVVLANTYHLHLRPGEETVRTLGGLHDFMGWSGPILTDSGGYQIFSLAHLTSIDEDGATLKSLVDGSDVRFTPESVIDIERDLGADVIMALDHCPPDPQERDAVAAATDRTHRWLERCVSRWRENGSEEAGQALFGIVQGGAFPDLRAASVQAVTEHDLVGYAIGGVSVGEQVDAMRVAVEAAAPLLPADRPRYLMGIGTPRDCLDAVAAGVDMFDCVTPTRHGRTHQAFTTGGRINLRNRRYRDDPTPLDPDADHELLRGFSRGYLRHLCKSDEMLGAMLLSLHNLRFFHRLMEDARQAIFDGTLPELRERARSWMDRA